MRNRDNPEVQVAIGDRNRLANVPAICQELFAAKTNCAGRAGGTGCEFEEDWRIFAPGNCWYRYPHRQNLDHTAAGDGGSYDAGYVTQLKRARSLLLADCLFQRENDDPFSQAGQKQRWPVRVVADLNHDNLT